MHDGQNLFNPSTSFSGYDWKVDETISNLISKKLINETIVVGIYNTRDRLKEYNLFHLQGSKYALFLINELKKYIDENYRTLSGYSHTAVMGSSMGGLCSFQLLMNYPEIFGKAACMSNSFWIDDRAIFQFIKSHNVPDYDKLYIDCGLKEYELIDDNTRMCVIMRRQSNDPEKFYCYFSEEGKHN
jgi:predicted alpha/beta superfamily hydrolase